jgi:hypothetical protein
MLSIGAWFLTIMELLLTIYIKKNHKTIGKILTNDLQTTSVILTNNSMPNTPQVQCLSDVTQLHILATKKQNTVLQRKWWDTEQFCNLPIKNTQKSSNFTPSRISVTYSLVFKLSERCHWEFQSLGMWWYRTGWFPPIQNISEITSLVAQPHNPMTKILMHSKKGKAILLQAW